MIFEQYVRFFGILLQFFLSRCSILFVFLVFYFLSTTKPFFYYTSLSTLVILFLNPQQTKYFGGLAIELKQVGLFAKYSRSEQTVYFLSWVFISIFFLFSFLLVRANKFLK
jgi:hypothetical protein